MSIQQGRSCRIRFLRTWGSTSLRLSCWGILILHLHPCRIETILCSYRYINVSHLLQNRWSYWTWTCVDLNLIVTSALFRGRNYWWHLHGHVLYMPGISVHLLSSQLLVQHGWEIIASLNNWTEIPHISVSEASESLNFSHGERSKLAERPANQKTYCVFVLSKQI